MYRSLHVQSAVCRLVCASLPLRATVLALIRGFTDARASTWGQRPDSVSTSDRAQGQLLAVWRHSVSDRDARTIVAARIPVLVLHGRHDIVAAPRHGEALARRSGCLLNVLKAI